MLLSILLATLSTSACGGDDDPRVQPPFSLVSLSATPERGFVPATATFSAELEWGDEETPVPSDEITWRWTFGDGSVDQNSGDTVTHTYIQQGTFTVTAEAWTSPRQRPAKITRQFRVDSPGDLSISELEISPLSINASDPLTVTVSLIASDLPTDLPVPLSLWAVPEDASHLRETQDASEAREALQLDEAVEFYRAELARPEDDAEEWSLELEGLRLPDSLASGRYRVYAYVDDAGSYSESNERNNGKFASHPLHFSNPVGDARRLNVRGVRARPARVNVLTTATWDFEIVNGGTADALFVNYEVWLTYGDVTLDPGTDQLLSSGVFPNLPPGAPFRVQDESAELTPAISELGEYFIIVRATTEAAGDEGYVQSASNAIIVSDEDIPGIDIVPLNFSISPSITYLDGSVTAYATILNQGSEDAPRSFQCSIYLMPTESMEEERSDLIIGSFTIRSLATNESVDLETVATIPGFLDTGTWHPFIYCNPNGLIPESDRSNNILRAESTLKVESSASIDLAIFSATVDPLVAQAGTPVEVSVEVCNGGTSGSTPTRLIVTQTRAGEYRAADDRRLMDVELPPVEAGECLMMSEQVIADCDTFVDTYELHAIVDPHELVPEFNRTNNTQRMRGPLKVVGPYCVCSPDPYEPNNSPATAALIEPNSGTISDLTMCGPALDWFKIPLLRGQSLRVTMSYEPRRGNLDMTLYAPDGTTVLDSSRRNDGTEDVSFYVVPSNGDYYIKVEGRTPEDRNRYSLSVSVDSPSPGTDLTIFDQSVSDLNVVPAQVIELIYSIVNLGDTPAPAQVVRTYWSQTPELDIAAAELVDEYTAGAISHRSATTRAIEVPPHDDGGEKYLIIVVDAREEIDDLNRANNIAVSEPINVDAGCSDPFEPNNSFHAATELQIELSQTPQRFENLRSCTHNPDFYRVCAGGGEALTFHVEFDPDDGDLDLRLYSEAQRIVGRAETMGSSETLSVPWINGDSCFTLEVYVVGLDRNVPYSLEVTRDQADEALSCNMRAEPNDSIADAAPLRDNLMEDLAVCPQDDEDYFSVALNGGQSVSFKLHPQAADSSPPPNLRLALFGPNQNFLAATVSSTEALRYTAPVAGTYYLRVRSNGGDIRSQGYRVEALGLDGVDLSVSGLSLSSSTLSAASQLQVAWLFSNSREIDAPATTTAVYLSSLPYLEASATLLREVATDALPGLTSRSEATKVGLPPGWSDSGPHYLLVQADAEQVSDDTDWSNNAQAIAVEVIGPCLPDIAEPNSLYLDAFNVDDLFAEDELSLCPGDEDWFYIDLSEGDSVEINLSFEHSAGDLDLSLFDSSLTLLLRSDSSTDNESISFTAAYSGRFYLKVNGFGPLTQNTYQLSVNPAD